MPRDTNCLNDKQRLGSSLLDSQKRFYVWCQKRDLKINESTFLSFTQCLGSAQVLVLMFLEGWLDFSERCFYPTLIAFNFPISSSLGLHKWTLRKLSDWIINLISANLFWRDILQLLNCSLHFENSSNTTSHLAHAVCLFSFQLVLKNLYFPWTQSKLFELVNLFRKMQMCFKTTNMFLAWS